MLCRDGDGRWSYAELAAALRFLGMTTTETKLCTGLLDADGSGTIERPELRAAINRHREDSELPLMDDSDAEKMADFTAPGLPSKVCRPVAFLFRPYICYCFRVDQVYMIEFYISASSPAGFESDLVMDVRGTKAESKGIRLPFVSRNRTLYEELSGATLACHNFQPEENNRFWVRLSDIGDLIDVELRAHSNVPLQLTQLVVAKYAGKTRTEIWRCTRTLLLIDMLRVAEFDHRFSGSIDLLLRLQTEGNGTDQRIILNQHLVELSLHLTTTMGAETVVPLADDAHDLKHITAQVSGHEVMHRVTLPEVYLPPPDQDRPLHCRLLGSATQSTQSILLMRSVIRFSSGATFVASPTSGVRDTLAEDVLLVVSARLVQIRIESADPSKVDDSLQMTLPTDGPVPLWFNVEQKEIYQGLWEVPCLA